jgi:GT2 family glycosyltransferase
MPADEFEVVFVDDGSPGEDTWQRLQSIRDSHENVRIERIENSGWPSRPRNVGLELAQGEYVLFMDHDDELYPHALEAGYAFAARAGADVLNGKETRTDEPKWATDVYTANAENVVDRQDVHPLIPTNPHKLFRRTMLMEHGIRFPEGRRVLWEDVFFALDVAQHAEVISVMADTPFYHWVRDGKTASSSYRADLTEYARWVREIVLQTNERLAAPRLRGQWRLMLLHQYRSRLLTQFSGALFRAPAETFEQVRTTAEELLHEHIPVELDALLTPTQRGRAALARAGRWDLLERLVPVDAGIVGIGRTTAVAWQDGRLHITAQSRWATPQGAPVALRYDGQRVVRDLPDEVAAALPDEAIDMSEAIVAASSVIGVRNRDTSVVWLVPGISAVRVDTVAGRPEPVATATAVLDPLTAACGGPLDKATWDVSVQNTFVGAVNQRGLRTTSPALVAVHGGHVYIAYRNKSGSLSLDVDQTNRSLAGSAPIDVARAVSVVRATGRVLPRRRSWSVSIALPFTGVATCDDTAIEGSVVVGDAARVPARVVARPGGGWLEATAELGRGRHHVVMVFHGREFDSGVEVCVGRGGDVTFARTG